MKAARIRLFVASILLVAWLGYLGYLVLYERHPVVVSRSQVMASTHFVLVNITLGPDGLPVTAVTVTQDLRPLGTPISGTIRFGSLRFARSWALSNSPAVSLPSPSVSQPANRSGSGHAPFAASSGVIPPSRFASSAANSRPLAFPVFTFSPFALWAYPVTPPWAFAHFMSGVVHVGQPFTFVPADPG